MANSKKDEATSALIKETISLASLLLTMYLMRKTTAPDFWRSLHMKGARAIKHFAQGQSDGWQKIADAAGTSYNKAKL